MTIPGRIEVSPNAIASLAAQAVLECYGVVGMASPNFVNGLAELLHIEQRNRGVHAHFEGDEISIDLYVILQHGTRISIVADEMMQSVKFAVERALGRSIKAVNVHVQGLR
ncbi:MAG: Asp23/Gls24 family envelope stress response protein, partial [Chloroflexi bacterium]|nr:Asp23/Gls24 family envelope stress response protein [Chloroflexota bacterium]